MWSFSLSPQFILAELEQHYLVAGLFPVEKLAQVADLLLHHLVEVAGHERQGVVFRVCYHPLGCPSDC